MSDERNDRFNYIDLFQCAVLNPQIAFSSFLKVGQALANQPEKIEKMQKDFFDRMLTLQKTFVTELCKQNDNCIEAKADSATGVFSAENVSDNPMIRFSHQYYKTVSDWLMNILDHMEDMDPQQLHSAKFFMKQYIDMMSPDNFPFLNPAVLGEMIKSNGENFKKGWELFIEDFQKGAITTNDSTYYSVGDNLATTPGKVIYQNDIIELIQYEATTPKVFAKPILFVPPWINKFYILDLHPEKSLVKWAVDQGFTVFMISWVNPDKRYSKIGFEDYIRDGLVAALDIIHDVTKMNSVHALGYCVGGTLISSFLAYISNPKATLKPKAKIESATLLATLLDFSRAGDMAIFMADAYMECIKAQLKAEGIMDGRIMYNTFSALKAKDMVWRYLINSYMLGKKPAPHDVLYWNADSTNLTNAMQTFLAQDLYRDNLLKTGKLEIFGVPMQLNLIKTPIYMISLLKDHLVPWEATYDGMKLFATNIRFVLGGSGHVVGAINPPSRNKYSYWVNDKVQETALEWLNTAIEKTGSWWQDWFEWLKPMAGAMIKAREIGKSIRNAPGEYVLNRRPQHLGDDRAQ